MSATVGHLFQDFASSKVAEKMLVDNAKPKTTGLIYQRQIRVLQVDVRRV